MYSCEKLARGKKTRFDSDERCIQHHSFDPKTRQASLEENKYEYNFADARKYRVQIALYEDRHRGLTYRLRKK